jgi:hypothetical protein
MLVRSMSPLRNSEVPAPSLPHRAVADGESRRNFELRGSTVEACPQVVASQVLPKAEARFRDDQRYGSDEVFAGAVVQLSPNPSTLLVLCAYERCCQFSRHSLGALHSCKAKMLRSGSSPPNGP